jgi:hypothetical protein
VDSVTNQSLGRFTDDAYSASMRRLLKLGIALIVSCLWVGCGKTKELNGPQIVYGGLGVSNHFEVGMNLKQIGKKNRDLKLTRYWKPDTRPWEKPFNKPQTIEAHIPSRGASVWGFNESQTFGELTFFLSDVPPTLLRIGTNEIALSETQSVTFDEIVRRFGEPKYHVDKSSRASLPALINAGQSSVVSNESNRILYYPADGVFFDFRAGSLERFHIVRRYADTNAAVRSN